MKLFIGTDISKDNFHSTIALPQEQGSVKAKKVNAFSNDRKGFKDFISHIKAEVENHNCAEAHVVMESTGVYGSNLCYTLQQKKILFSVVNGRQILDFIRSKNLRTKTDNVDAKAIAEFAAYFNPRPTKLPEGKLKILWDLVNFREGLKDDLIRVKCKMEPVKFDKQKTKICLRYLIQQKKLLEKQIAKLDKEIESIIETDDVLREKCSLLRTIPGVAKSAEIILVWLLILPEGMKLSQVIAMAGMCPQTAQSGTSVNRKGHMDKRGNRLIRRLMFMLALSAIRYNPPVKEFYERKVSRGSAKKKAVVCSGVKLLRICYGVLKHGKAFDPNWRKRSA